MTKLTVTKTSFTAGEIDPALFGRVDLRAYDEGAATLRNVVVERTGGVSRRPGTEFLTDVPSGGRLFSYERGTIHDLLVFGNYSVRVVTNGSVTQTIEDLPWPAEELGQLDFTLVDEAVLVCHPNWRPRLLRRDAASQWNAAVLAFAAFNANDDDERIALPFARFAPASVAIQATGIGGETLPTPVGRGKDVELRSTAAVFDPNFHTDTFIRLKGRQLRIFAVAPDGEGMVAYARTLEPLIDTLATYDWDEQAFSDLHGWPVTAAMHQNRLVLGGCRDAADYLWFSRSGQPFNFDLADGIDDAAIAFRITAERRHEIRQLFSGRVLQVFTTAGEWTVGGFPLTPSTARVELQTRVGSLADRQIAPVDVDGATLFVGATGRDLREFLFTDTEQAYQAADIAVLSRHLMQDPVDMVFDQSRRVFWIVRGDGRACTVTIDRNSNIVAWSLQDTKGTIRAITIHNGSVILLVERQGVIGTERIDDSQVLDAYRLLTASQPKTQFDGLGATADGRYYVRADGIDQGELEIENGQVTLSSPASAVELGFGFETAVEGLPLVGVGGRSFSPQVVHRPIRIALRLGPSDSLMLDTGSGMRPFSIGRTAGTKDVFDVSVRARGWRRGTAALPWRLAQAAPMPLKLLSVTVEAKVND
jgi:hypothetical protein